MVQSFDSSNYTNHYISKFCSTNPFFEAFQNLLLSKHLYEETEFNYGKEYEKYFKKISEEHQTSDSTYDAIAFFELPEIETIKRYCRTWFPRDPDATSKVPGERNSIILMGFVMIFNPDETNLLLKSAGFSELGGRIFDEAIIIYSLNNKLSYDKYIETHNKMKLIYNDYISKEIKINNDIKSFSDLNNYVNANETQDSLTVQKPTVTLTNEVKSITSEAQLIEYVKSNALVFSEYRETARRYLCKYLFTQLEKEQNRYKNGQMTYNEEEVSLSHFVNHKIDSEKISFEHIWNQFEKFYCFTVRVDTVDSIDQINIPYDGNEYDFSFKRTAHLLSKFINGKREITRKFFILFLIFLGLRNSKKIDHCCANCGFDIINNDYIDNGFDDFVYHLLRQEDQKEFRLFLANVTEEIAEVGFVPPIYLYKRGEL